MDFKWIHRFAKVLLLLIVLLKSYNANAQTSWSNNLVVIGNNLGTTKLTQDYLKQTFKGKYSLWSNGQAVTIVLPSSKSAQAPEFASVVMGMSVTGMQKYWLSLVFQGRANPPAFFETSNDIVKFVASTSGAIAVIPANTPDVPNYLIIKIQN
jgi:ABC-type phosphate transport system substrate-binding protein